MFKRIFLYSLFRASSHEIVGNNNWTEFTFKVTFSNSNFALTLGYLNPALKNLALTNSIGLSKANKGSVYTEEGPGKMFTRLPAAIGAVKTFKLRLAPKSF